MQVAHSQIEHLLTNNEEPSELAAQEVRKLLLEPTEELESLDAEIQQLETHLEELKSKREKVKEKITRYSTILSPIRRIPADVLYEIFGHCLSCNRNPVMLATEAPVLLTRICSSWRSIVLSSPHLWSRLHIAFTDQDLMADFDDPQTWQSEDVSTRFPKARIIQILRLRCEAIEEWLRRSGSCPLSLSICYTSDIFRGESGTTTTLKLSDITAQLFKILINVSERWRHIEIVMPLEVYYGLEDSLTTSRFDYLTTLRMSFPNQWRAQVKALKVLQAQNLRKISFDAKLPDDVSNGRNLTCISLHTSLSPSNAANLLRQCPALIHFKVTMATNFPPLTLDIPEALRNPIFLPHLRALHIIESVVYDYLGNIYDCIIAPELRWITHSVTTLRNRTNNLNDNPTLPIAALLRKSARLKKLTVDTSDYTDSEMRELFQSACDITHLVLGPERRKDIWPAPTGRYITSWDFGHLFGDQNSAETTSDGIHGLSDALLLPHLQTLEITAQVASLSDEALLRFIISRMVPSPSSTLSKVGVIFTRRAKLNIEEDVLKHAKLVGTTSQIELDLFYMGPVLEYSWQPIHPEYGSVDYNVGWNEDDNDEEMVLS